MDSAPQQPHQPFDEAVDTVAVEDTSWPRMC
jgi:hypothetical protein